MTGLEHVSTYPQEGPNCASIGGKTNDLSGFANGTYQSSTEASAAAAKIISPSQTALTTIFQRGLRTTFLAFAGISGGVKEIWVPSHFLRLEFFKKMMTLL